MKYKDLIVYTVLIIITTVSAGGYWHLIYEPPNHGMRKLVGDSSALYSCYIFNGGPRIDISRDLGRNWKTFFEADYDYYSPIKYFRGCRYPAPGYMYLLMSNSKAQKEDSLTAILRIDDITGEVLDTCYIYDKHGAAKLNRFTMFDSTSGMIASGSYLVITRDGWKTYTHFSHDLVFNEDSTDFTGNYRFGMTEPKMISKDTVFFLGSDWGVVYTDEPNACRGFYRMVIGKGDSTLSFTELADGINLEISKDSILKLNRSVNIYTQKYPTNYAYINDSTWVYKSPGKKTGYGNCRTLELFKTYNRGKTYKQVCYLDLNAFGLSEVEFENETTGHALGNSVALISHDAGDTWQVDTAYFHNNWTPYTSPINGVDISFVDGMKFLTSWNVGVFKYEEEFGVGIRETPVKPKECLVYPNPSQPGEMLNFKLSKFFSGEAFVYDLYGKKIQQVGFFGNSFRLRENIAPGTYLVCLMSGGEVVAREKINVK